jgi:hypothetical protein
MFKKIIIFIFIFFAFITSGNASMYDSTNCNQVFSWNLTNHNLCIDVFWWDKFKIYTVDYQENEVVLWTNLLLNDINWSWLFFQNWPLKFYVRIYQIWDDVFWIANTYYNFYWVDYIIDSNLDFWLLWNINDINDSPELISNNMSTVASSFASGWISEAWSIATSPIGYPIIFSIAIILIWIIIGWLFYIIRINRKTDNNYSPSLWTVEKLRKPFRKKFKNEKLKKYVNRKNKYTYN